MERAQRQKWNVVALDLGIDLSTPNGEFMASVLAAMARWERRIIGQRTKGGDGRSAREGRAARPTVRAPVAGAGTAPRPARPGADPDRHRRPAQRRRRTDRDRHEVDDLGRALVHPLGPA